MTTSRLERVGYTPIWGFYLAELGGEYLPARVCRVDRGRCRVLTDGGERAAIAAQKLELMESGEAASPAVGDWVACLERADQLVIEAIMPRRSVFARSRHSGASARQVLATNIDVAFIVMGLDGDYNLRRVERYLALVRAAGDARAIIVLNKADLHDDVERFRDDVFRVAPGAGVVALSALRDEELGAISCELDGGSTGAFFGSSGAGKSTLINRLLGEERLATSAVRADDARGRHTTSFRELFLLPSGGAVIDTAGLREVGVLGDEEALGEVFEEIAALAAACRFGDCQHVDEPGCAVREAVDGGELAEDRLESYLALRDEQRSAARRQQVHTQRAHEKATFGRYRRDLKVIKKLKEGG